jgi:hypothetical protein
VLRAAITSSAPRSIVPLLISLPMRLGCIGHTGVRRCPKIARLIREKREVEAAVVRIAKLATLDM